MRRAEIYVLAGFVVAVQLVTGPAYGLFRDELYYLACADHLAWGYVDQPPFSIAVLAVVRALLGDSLFALRLVPALLDGALVVLAAELSRTLGGSRFAQALAALAVALTPAFLAECGFYSMNAFDLVFWSLAILIVARIVTSDDRRGWLPLGVVLGLGLENKISILFLGAGLAVALLVTPLRRHLRRREPWLALAIALLLFAPHVVWQARHGWPTLEFIENATRYKNTALSPAQFLVGQVIQINPVNALLWLPGLVWLCAGRFRALGVVYLVAYGVMTLNHSKPYYLSPAYPMLLAAGATLFDRFRLRARIPVAVLIGAAGLASAPLAIPILPVDTLIRYQAALGLHRTADEKSDLGPLDQHFADRFGWRELTAAVVAVYRALPPDERARVAVVTSNYGEAGALAYYSRAAGLPAPVSQHNSYYDWGPGRDEVDVAIIVGVDEENLRSSWRSCEPVATFHSPYAMPFETRRPILLCRGLLLPLDEAWRRGKHFI